MGSGQLRQGLRKPHPADAREVVGIFQRSGAAEVQLAVEAAQAAFKKWSCVPAPRRAEIIMKAAGIVSGRKKASRAT